VADDRPADDATAQLAKLQRDFDDLKSTLMVRAGRMPTGSIEPTILTTAPADTLIMQGQVVSRATYPVLWKWVQDNSLLAVGLFGPGDGSSTFGLPDFRGKVLRHIDATGTAVGAQIGADSVALTTANLPGHTHTVTLSSDGQHQHDFLTAQGGDHGGHVVGTAVITANGADHTIPTAYANSGTHNHSGTTAYNSNHSHTASAASTGSGTAMDNRQASVGVQWLIWT
jgi:microcystin-dependent protein